MEFYSAKYKIQKYIDGKWVDNDLKKGTVVVIAESHDLAVDKVNLMLDLMISNKEKFRAVLYSTVRKCIGIGNFEIELSRNMKLFYY